jgi:hypothetical protein
MIYWIDPEKKLITKQIIKVFTMIDDIHRKMNEFVLILFGERLKMLE